MVVLDVLADNGTVRFTNLGKLAGGVSQKMLTKTVRQMESDGLVKRTVHPVVPPHVDYALTDLGRSLGEAFCGVWLWAREKLRRRRSISGRLHPRGTWPSREPQLPLFSILSASPAHLDQLIFGFRCVR